MTETASKAERFRALHVPGQPLVLFNIWDAGSAKAVAAEGASALATSSGAVADALGFADGEQIPLELALQNLKRIVAVTELPVSVDLERGYGDVGETVRQASEAGAVGGNLEDSIPAKATLRTREEQAQRLRQARQAVGSSFFINARTDVFLQKPAEQQDAALLEEALERAQAYADAGSDGLFAPGLADLGLIARLVERSPLPVNIIDVNATLSLSALAEAGVARVSYGPRFYRVAMGALREAARAASGAISLP